MAKTTKNSNDILDKLFNALIYVEREKNTTTEITCCKLLEIDDWTSITPKELQKRIADGAVVNWIDGYDIGPSPLTNALQQGASSEIIAILVANGADINAPTVLPSGTKVTPLEIVRLQPATHDNMQKELILLRAGVLDDAINWVKQQRKDGNLEDLFKKGTCLRKHLHYLGYSRGNRVFECGCNSYIYIKEKAGTFKDDCDFEIYDAEVVECVDKYITNMGIATVYGLDTLKVLNTIECGEVECDLTDVVASLKLEEICEGDSTYIKAVATPKSKGYTYEFFNGKTSLNDDKPIKVDSFFVKEAGSYSVTVYNEEIAGCKISSKSVKLTVNPLPDVALENGVALCDGEGLDLSKATIEGYDLNWYSDDVAAFEVTDLNIDGKDVLGAY